MATHPRGQGVASLLPEWETTNVEFKRQLDLANGPEGRVRARHPRPGHHQVERGALLIVGFDDRTPAVRPKRRPAITQNRLEQLLNAYAAPAPEIRYHRVAWDQGEIGVIKVLRDPAKVPYRVNKTLAHISKDDVYVRHESQVERPR